MCSTKENKKKNDNETNNNKSIYTFFWRNVSSENINKIKDIRNTRGH